jgi:hypothetical protein
MQTTWPPSHVLMPPQVTLCPQGAPTTQQIHVLVSLANPSSTTTSVVCNSPQQVVNPQLGSSWQQV